MNNPQNDQGNQFWKNSRGLRILFLFLPPMLAVWASSSMNPIFVIVEFFLYFGLVFFRVFIEISGSLNFDKSRKDRIFHLILLVGYSISMMIMFAAVYKHYGLVVDGGFILPSWLDSIYFSVVTWTTLGYGDIQPNGSIRMVAIFQAYIGYLYMGLLAGGIASLVFSRDKNS